MKLFTVGATFVHQYVANFVVDRFPRESLTLARTVTEVGSGCAARAYAALDVRPHRVVPFALNEYGEASSHTHASAAAVMLSEPADHSGPVLSENVNVGAEISILIVLAEATVV